MKKVVVERPRWGSRRPNKKFGERIRYVEGEDYEDQPKRASISESHRYKWPEKGFTDVLGPLERMLRKYVGRPWNDVYSEMCASLDKRKVTGKHIFDHLESMVEVDCYEGADGKMYTLQQDYRVSGLYVHPQSGLLCVAPKLSWNERRGSPKPAAKPIELLKVDEATEYRKLQGIWYWIRYDKVWVRDRCIYRWEGFEKGYVLYDRGIWDILERRIVRYASGVHRMAVEKKQCNRDELVQVRALLQQEEVKRKL